MHLNEKKEYMFQIFTVYVEGNETFTGLNSSLYLEISMQCPIIKELKSTFPGYMK